MQAFSLYPTTEPLEGSTGIQRAVIDGEAMTITRYDLQEGAAFPQHRHPEEQITLVLDGTMEFVVDGARHDLGTGGIIVIPSGASHAAVAGAEGASVVCIVTPRRSSSRVEMFE